MKTKYFFLAGFAAMLASCANEEYIGDTSPNATLEQTGDGSIQFSSNLPNMTRAGEFKGATAAEKLGGMFVVEGTKGTEASDAPSSTVVFDNYLVGYTANTAGKTESNTHNWEYVGKQTGIDGRMTSATWTALHNNSTDAKSQTIKYWDYSTSQYDFIAWSTGNREAITTTAEDGKIQVTRINTGTTLATNGFQMTAVDADDLLECYYTDINTVPKANYGTPVTLTFRNMAAKVRIALYETVPGYSVTNVMFYTSDANPTAPTDLGSGTSSTAALFTMGSDRIPKSGSVLVTYPHIGKTHRDATPQTADYNKASVTVTPGTAVGTSLGFGTLTNQYRDETGNEPDGKYLGTSLPNATFAGAVGDNYYTAVIPNTNGKPLTLRVDYTLVSTDGSAETINVKGAKAVVPATYTVWQPNYAYTYIFKISDNSNGYTGTKDDPKGLFPITFDAVVTNFVDVNAEQTTVTTVATPSITTYQQGHDNSTDEYSKSQTAGVSSEVKDLYVQVMDNSDDNFGSNTTPTLKSDLNGTKKSLLFAVATTGAPISEATVIDALENRTNLYNDVSPAGRNGITLTTNGKIDNTVETIVNGVDDQPITVTANTTAKIDIDQLDAGIYAYVYSTTVPSDDDAVFNVVTDAEATAHPTLYYEVLLTASDGIGNVLTSGTAVENHVYFVKNLDKDNKFVSYTFKQTKVDDSVVGLVDGGAITIGTKATEHHASDASNKYFYFDAYNHNNGAYAVKVIKVVE